MSNEARRKLGIIQRKKEKEKEKEKETKKKLERKTIMREGGGGRGSSQ